MCESVEHLDRALGPSQVEDLVSSAVILNRFDVSNIVVAAHLSPAIFPKVRIIDRERNVLLAVLSATVIANPDVVSSFSELEMHGYT